MESDLDWPGQCLFINVSGALYCKESISFMNLCDFRSDWRGNWMPEVTLVTTLVTFMVNSETKILKGKGLILKSIFTNIVLVWIFDSFDREWRWWSFMWHLNDQIFESKGIRNDVWSEELFVPDLTCVLWRHYTSVVNLRRQRVGLEGRKWIPPVDIH